MWRITKAELQTLGFIMAVHSEPSLGNPPNILHINVLEFIALLVNVWFQLAICHAHDPLHQQHHIGNFLTDNTLALPLCLILNTHFDLIHCQPWGIVECLTLHHIPRLCMSLNSL